MNVRAMRYDMAYFISAGLLATFVVTAVTGLVSDLWDLNEFIFHKTAGYAVALLGLIHVVLHWNRLVAYISWRLKGHPRGRRTSGRGEGRRKQDRATETGSQVSWSRRRFVPLALGGVGGFALGWLLRPAPALPYGEDVGAIYHEWSKPKLLSLLGTVADWGQSPPLYKHYAEARRIPLPKVGAFRGLTAEEAIERRRSQRNFAKEPMTLEELSRLLHYTDGITGERRGRKVRAAPSAGALYPMEIYPVIHRVEELEAGLYHYAVQEHALELLRAGNLRGEIVTQGLMQEFLGQANVVLVFTAILQRLRWKYQERSYRYALLEAGHLGQNVYLAATSMGLGACAVGAFLDDGLNKLLGVDGQEEAAIYMLAVGKI